MEISLEERIARLETESAIMNLLARFDDAVIRGDAALFASLWTEDAIWEIDAPFPLYKQGIPAILDALSQFNARNEFLFRTTLRPLIEISGDTATLRVPTTEFGRFRENGNGYNNVAFYEDEVRRGPDGTWRFSRRRYRYVWVDVNTPLPGQAVALSESAAA